MYIVHKHCAEVSNNVDDTKDQTSSAKHGEVGSAIIARDRSTRLGVEVERRSAISIMRHGVKPIVDFLGSSKLVTLHIYQEDEHHEHNVHCKKADNPPLL